MVRLAKPLVLLLALVVLLGMANTALADRVTGVVIGMGGSIVVRGDDARFYNFRVIANSNFRLNGSQVQFTDLQVGDRVAVLYDDNDGFLIIREMDGQR